MMPSPPASIRSPALVSAIDRALQGEMAGLYSMLARLSGLPGPVANWSLAEVVGRHLAGAGPRAWPIISMLEKPTGPIASSPACAFFPVCGAMALAHLYLDDKSETERAKWMLALREAADDTRHIVRDGVVRALWVIGRGNAQELTVALAEWTSDYLPSAVALEAIAGRALLDGIRDPEPVLRRLEESMDLVVHAQRADERSQGYRLLLRTMAGLSATLLARFPKVTQDWFEARIFAENRDRRHAVEQMLEALPERADPEGRLRPIERAMRATAPPLRDPRTYVGPTRRRGARRSH